MTPRGFLFSLSHDVNQSDKEQTRRTSHSTIHEQKFANERPPQKRNSKEESYSLCLKETMASRPTIAMLPPEDTGHEEEHQSSSTAVENSNNSHSVATLSSPWQFDDIQVACSSCQNEFNAFNRRHHCRLCGKIFCHDCSSQR